MEENLFPSIMSINSREEVEEERRLFYVAMTMDKINFRLLAIFYTLLIVVLSLIPIPETIPRFKLFEMDKLIHLILYLTFIMLWGLSLFKSSFSLKLLLSIAILFGLFLEFLQHILPFGRYFEWVDFIANSTGAIIGAIILLFLKKKLL